MILDDLNNVLISLLTFLISSPLVRHLAKHLLFAAGLVLLLTAIFAVRVLVLLPPIRSKLRLRVERSPQRQQGDTCKTALFLGSGGHTTELLLLLSHLDPQRYTPRIYFVSSNDDFSKSKAEELEKAWDQGEDNYTIITLPRARNIRQSWFTTPLTVLKSFKAAYHCTSPSTHDHDGREEAFADLLLMNGPGTCVPLLLANYVHQLLPLWPNFFLSPPRPRPRPRFIYIESFARVKTLSLTGKVLKWAVDRFVTQWRTGEGDGAEKYSDTITKGMSSEGLSRHWLV